MRQRDDRDSVIKDDLLLLTRSGIAWEALRRNLVYLNVAKHADANRIPLRSRPPLTIIEAPISAEAEKIGTPFP